MLLSILTKNCENMFEFFRNGPKNRLYIIKMNTELNSDLRLYLRRTHDISGHNYCECSTCVFSSIASLR